MTELTDPAGQGSLDDRIRSLVGRVVAASPPPPDLLFAPERQRRRPVRVAVLAAAALSLVVAVTLVLARDRRDTATVAAVPGESVELVLVGTSQLEVEGVATAAMRVEVDRRLRVDVVVANGQLCVPGPAAPTICTSVDPSGVTTLVGHAGKEQALIAVVPLMSAFVVVDGPTGQFSQRPVQGIVVLPLSRGGDATTLTGYDAGGTKLYVTTL